MNTAQELMPFQLESKEVRLIKEENGVLLYRVTIKKHIESVAQKICNSLPISI